MRWDQVRPVMQHSRILSAFPPPTPLGLSASHTALFKCSIFCFFKINNLFYSLCVFLSAVSCECSIQRACSLPFLCPAWVVGANSGSSLGLKILSKLPKGCLVLSVMASQLTTVFSMVRGFSGTLADYLYSLWVKGSHSSAQWPNSPIKGRHHPSTEA